MTEKRFSKCKDMCKVFDWETSKTLNFKEIINLLNELAEENKELKMELEECRNNKLFSRRELERENKELKQLIKKVIDERVVDYPLLCKLKEMVKE